MKKWIRFGRKLLITGKGRCNITNNIPIEEFINNVPTNGKFLYSAFNNFTNQDIIKMLNDSGVRTKVERGERVFPISDKSKDVLEAFLMILKKINVKIKLNSKVTKIVQEKRNRKRCICKW